MLKKDWRKIAKRMVRKTTTFKSGDGLAIEALIANALKNAYLQGCADASEIYKGNTTLLERKDSLWDCLLVVPF